FQAYVNKKLPTLEREREREPTKINKEKNDFENIQVGLAEIRSEMSSIDSKLDKVTQRLDTSERRIEDIEDRVYHLENLASEIHYLREKCDDLENRARRSNLRIVRLSEGIEGKDPVAFIEKFLVEVLGETCPGRVEIECVHHALRPRPKEGEKPRIMIFKVLRFQDKVRILRRAREKGQLTYLHQKIFFFPDVSAELQARRRKFTEARRLCHSMQLSFSLLHPAKLRVSLKDAPKFFTDPKQLRKYFGKEEIKARLGAPISEQEIREAVKSLQSGKS
uniref:L1 transposable element RRM domain-containing protein n=1 Tax=Latimeria chalumnae TaxID=7897 RepID=H3BGT2_LATCH